MIFNKTQKKRRFGRSLLAVLLAAVMLLGTSCGTDESGEEKKRGASQKTAEPSIGIGRELETKKVNEPVEPKDYTICVDPGHGFVDGGTGEGVFEDGILEKDVNLAVAKLIVEELEALGFKTVMTHDGVNLPAADTDGNQVFNPSERVAYANSLDIDYFVSIHVNSFDDTSVNGMQIYYEQNWRKVNEWSEPIADHIADCLADAFPDAKETTIWGNEEDKTLAVTRETNAASSLIEIGFCTNETDRNNMIDPEWQSVFASAVAEGINKFFTELDD